MNTKSVTNNKRKAEWKEWNGFAVEIVETTPIDGILLQDGRPVATVSSVSEARGVAAYRSRRSSGTYVLWARGIEGEYIVVPCEIR